MSDASQKLAGVEVREMFTHLEASVWTINKFKKARKHLIYDLSELSEPVTD